MIKKCFYALQILFLVFATNIVAQNQNADPYKDYNQLVVFDSTFVQMTPSGLCYTIQHIRYKALNAEGVRQLSSIKYDYEPLSADVQIRSAAVIRNDNGVTPIDLKTVIDYTAPARAIYWGARQKLIPVGRIEPNDMVDVVLHRKGFTYALLRADDEDKFIPPMRGEFYEIINFFGSNPILTQYYEVSIPLDKPIFYKTYVGDIKIVDNRTPDSHKISFCLNNIFPLKMEANSLGLSDIAPKAIITTTEKWEEKSRWFYNVNESYGSFNCTDELKALVNKLLVSSSNELDSIHALTHWVADNMRYSGLTMGKGEGYTLHNVPMNLSDRCGVCKDKASLLVSMLRAAGFKAYAAMTMAGSRIENIPADQFNHSVTAVVMHDGKIQMLDPTWVPYNRELWSSLEQQQNYLIGTKEGMTLMETPVSAPENHYLKIENKATLDQKGTLIGQFTIRAEGQSDAMVRGMLTGAKYRREIGVERELKKYNSAIVITSWSGIDDPYTYKNPVKLVINYTIPNYAFVGKKELLFNPPLTTGFFKDFCWDLGVSSTIETRKYPFKGRCTQYVEMNEEINLPTYSNVLYQPKEVQDIKGEAADYSVKFELKADKYIFKNNIQLKKRVFDVKDWQNMRSVIEQHKKVMAENIVLEK